MEMVKEIKMINYKHLRADLKQNYTQQNVTDMLAFIGYEIDRSHKFRLRNENTPSASIAKNGQIFDFGGPGWSGDLVSVLHDYHNLSLSESVLYVAKLMNINIERYKND